MIKKAIEIQLSSGLEARPVAVLVQVASQFESSVSLQSGGKKINAKSIMGMMSLGLVSGEQVEIICDGEDEEKAVEGIRCYLSGQTQAS